MKYTERKLGLMWTAAFIWLLGIGPIIVVAKDGLYTNITGGMALQAAGICCSVPVIVLGLAFYISRGQNN